MQTTASVQSFGLVTRILHWLTALLILTAIPLGVIANRLPYDTSAALAQKAQLFSLHKTLGMAAFAVAVIRILWALRQPHPSPLHPDRKAETLLAGVIHWTLYLSLVAVPLSGWVHHAATAGFAPILWPLGQSLPFVPLSETVAAIAASAHWVFTKLLAASILLHIAGALKHHLIDKDATLRRMWRGTATPAGPRPATLLPAVLAFAVYGAGTGLALSLVPAADVVRPSADRPAPTAGNWVTESGTIGIRVRQLASEVTGQFATWSADIAFDPDAADPLGQVTARIDIASLTLGSITPQALAADFLNAKSHPEARFDATLHKTGTAYEARGTLTLLGQSHPLTLPFDLQIKGDTAQMTGTTQIDRRIFGIGANYADEATVGFMTTITITLTATRQPG